MADFLDDLWNGKIDFVIGLLVAFSVWIFLQLKSYFREIVYRSDARRYVGEYFFYHFAPSGRDEICVGRMDIRYEYGRLKAFGESYEFKYRGHVTVGRNFYVSLKCINFEECWNFIFPIVPPVERIHKLTGVSCGVSPFYEPVAYRVILYSQKQNEIDVRADLNEAQGSENKCLIRVGIDSSIRDDNVL